MLSVRAMISFGWPMMSSRRAAWIVVVSGVAVATIASGAGRRSYTIDPSRSSATIEVGKAGVLSFAAGHTHEVIAPALAGTLTIDIDDPARSTVTVTIDASTLRVTGRGEPPEDVPKVQAAMSGPQVLDVQRYPVIRFAATSVAISSRTGATLQAAVTGRLTLHDVSQSITVPVTVRTEGDSLTATGHFPIKQTAYGMKPVSVGGVVSVKDTLNIGFTIVAR